MSGMHLPPTPSQTVGPYLSLGLAPLERRRLAEPGSPSAVKVTGRLLDGAWAPVPDGMVEIWQADPRGDYPAGPSGWSGWGRSLTDAEGRYAFDTVKPGRVATSDGGWQAPHLDMLVFARGLLRPVRTRLYFPDEQSANEADPVLAGVPAERRHTLIATDTGGALQFDIRLQGEDETVFFGC